MSSADSHYIVCPNCDSLMNAGESCPECEHEDSDDCECTFCASLSEDEDE